MIIDAANGADNAYHSFSFACKTCLIFFDYMTFKILNPDNSYRTKN